MLALRRSSNPIGWLLLANGLVLTAHQVATPYADYAALEDPGALPGAEWAVLVHERAWPTLFICPTAIALVFPDGRLPSPRWRPVAIVAAVSFAALTVVSLLAAGRYSEQFDHVSSPLPELSEAVVGLPFAVSGLGALAGLVAAAVALRTRMRRASLVERLQLKWLAYAAVLVPAAVVVSMIESTITGGEGAVTVVATTLALDRDTGRHRRRGDALPPVRDRPADQPHARLRDPDRGAGGDVRRRLADVGRRDRLGFHAPDGGRHARGRARVRAAALARPDPGRPALRPGAIRGPAEDRTATSRTSEPAASLRRRRAR